MTKNSNFVAPSDWPGPGPIDLNVHDLPHNSSDTEWWYINGHFVGEDDKQYSFFASFFRIAKDVLEDGTITHAHALNWAIVDVANKSYYADPILDPSTPEILKEQLIKGYYNIDARLNRAFLEIVSRGNVPLPDRVFEAPVTVSMTSLDLDFGTNTMNKDADGNYHVYCHNENRGMELNIKFEPLKQPTRQGHDGFTQVGLKSDTMFYYYIPRNRMTGSVKVGGKEIKIKQGSCWYDHEFGGVIQQSKRKNASDLPEEEEKEKVSYAWNWFSCQLDNGTDITATMLVNPDTKEIFDNFSVIVDKDGNRTEYADISLVGTNSWTSPRTTHDYPQTWTLTIPAANLQIVGASEFENQEFITLISKPAFWEGRVRVTGTINGEQVTGLGFLERHGFQHLNSLDDFFKRISKQVLEQIELVLPQDANYDQVRRLMASAEMDHYMDGVNLDVYKNTIIEPLRAIIDRGGKSWRSYACLLCIDCVGGDSTKFKHWLAMPEIMHVGSLIVDDIQDKSESRRGGPSCHKVYGDAVAINSGTAAYFVSLHTLQYFTPWLTDAQRLKMYDVYFLCLRAGHAGQAFDINGLDYLMPEAVESGLSERLEKSVLCTHRLKSAVPAGCLARIGAQIGGGSDDQVETIGRYFESIGLAFQVIDDVLNLRGLPGKTRGEDITAGKVTFPVAKAMSKLNKEERVWLWNMLQSHPEDPAVIETVINKLEECGAIQASQDHAEDMVREAWEKVDRTIPDSFYKMLLRSFGWYVLERHY